MSEREGEREGLENWEVPGKNQQRRVEGERHNFNHVEMALTAGRSGRARERTTSTTRKRLEVQGEASEGSSGHMQSREAGLGSWSHLVTQVCVTSDDSTSALTLRCQFKARAQRRERNEGREKCN